MNRPAIVLAHWEGVDPYTDADLLRLDTAGRLLDRVPLQSWDDGRADALLAEAEILVGHWGCPPLDEAMLARAQKLRMFAYGAGTVKMQVTPAAWDRELRITSGADANGEPVAEFTLAAILMANKDVFWRADRAKGGPGWDRPPGAAEVGNYDKTIGIVAASLIGRRVIELLRPFPRLTAIVYDPFLTDDDAAALGVEKVDDLTDLCRRSNVLSIHAPSLPSTMHLVGREQLAALPDAATLINTARGAVLDHDALLDELRPGRICAILDVTDPEPLPDDSEFLTLPNVALTPHVAGSQGTELRRMADWVCDEVERYVEGRPARNPITRDIIDRTA